MSDLTIIVIIALFCNGLFFICNDDTGMIFSFIGRWYKRFTTKRMKRFNEDCINKKGKVGGNSCYLTQSKNYAYRYDWIYDPVFGCFKCMPLIWGTIIYFLLGDFNIIHWPFIIVASSGFSLVVFANGAKKL